MKEAEFWSQRLRPTLVKQCQSLELRHHFERVENVVAEGTPDVDYCIAGVAGKLELKFGYDPVGEATPVLGKGNGLRRSQIIFAARRVWAGGLVFCVIGTPKRTWVIDLRGMLPEDMDGIALWGRAQLAATASWASGQQAGGTLPLTLIDDPLYRTPLKAGA